jgi:hypothetical protein
MIVKNALVDATLDIGYMFDASSHLFLEQDILRYYENPKAVVLL